MVHFSCWLICWYVTFHLLFLLLDSDQKVQRGRTPTEGALHLWNRLQSDVKYNVRRTLQCRFREAFFPSPLFFYLFLFFLGVATVVLKTKWGDHKWRTWKEETTQRGKYGQLRSTRSTSVSKRVGLVCHRPCVDMLKEIYFMNVTQQSSQTSQIKSADSLTRSILQILSLWHLGPRHR